MLTITLPGIEHFDNDKQEFFTVGDLTIQLEHSLVSLSAWEAMHEKPFLNDTEKTTEEVLSYISCMILGEVDLVEVIDRLDSDILSQINDYINKASSATTFREEQAKRGRRQIVTSEIIYHWMIALSIPIECETWHLNKLFSLIRVCNDKNQSSNPNKTMSRAEIAKRNAELNAQRKSQHQTSG